MLAGGLAAASIGACTCSTPATDQHQVESEPEVPETEASCRKLEGDPGRVTLHRLNRTEYDNTVRDLLGDTTGPAKEFPADEHGEGFDNNADVLTLSPLLLEKYEKAARRLIEEAWSRDYIPAQQDQQTADTITGVPGPWASEEGGELSATFEFRSTGRFVVSAQAFGVSSRGEAPKLQLKVDGRPAGEFVVEATEAPGQVYQAEVEVLAGAHRVSAEFLNPTGPGEDASRKRMLSVGFLQLDRQGFAAPPESVRLRTCAPEAEGEACAQQILSSFANRAWRRPVGADELEPLLAIARDEVAAGGGWDDGVKLALEAALLSPDFLFRVELDPDPNSCEPHPVDPYALASRLSYFLWSTMPDDALFAAAANGELGTPAGIEAQVRRMLEDPKAGALIDNFAGQWLHTRRVATIEPSTQYFPTFDEPLREAMRAETDAFMRSFLTEDVSALDMLDADFTFLNDRLAAHYGLPLPGSQELVRTPLATEQRRGLLSHASLLAVTSHPDRTSPVIRGAFILSQILCRQPAPPPDNVPELTIPAQPNASLRAQLEQHRANPSCAGCHASIDPLGFALEKYDAIGAWREQDRGGFPIDTLGSLPDGTTVDSATTLGRVIKADPRFPECMARQMLTYALGRGLGAGADREQLDALLKGFEAKGYRLRELIIAVATSRPFTMRRGEPEESR